MAEGFMILLLYNAWICCSLFFDVWEFIFVAMYWMFMYVCIKGYWWLGYCDQVVGMIVVPQLMQSDKVSDLNHSELLASKINQLRGRYSPSGHSFWRRKHKIKKRFVVHWTTSLELTCNCFKASQRERMK